MYDYIRGSLRTLIKKGTECKNRYRFVHSRMYLGKGIEK